MEQTLLLEMTGSVKASIPLEVLLKDRTTNNWIIWATNSYRRFGSRFAADKPILPIFITSEPPFIRPRYQKSSHERSDRSRKKAEVFTPSWICNIQNNLVDYEWFGYDAFNVADEGTWTTITEPVTFPKEKTWQDYVQDVRLEMTCGEAPYIVSRYDTVTGEEIELKNRIGLLDRKIRVVNENASEDDWYLFVKKAFQSTYGFDWQGDNVVLARLNLVYTFIDYYLDKFGTGPTEEQLTEICEIISWNIWQMDGTKFVIPNSCKDAVFQMTIDGTKVAVSKCEGCEKGLYKKHNGKYCTIMDWSKNTRVKFRDMVKG